MDRPLHVSLELFPTFPSGHLAILLTGMLAMITFANNSCFGLTDTGQWGLEGNTTVDRKEEASNFAIPTIHGTSYRSLSITPYVPHVLHFSALHSV
jgi:hypothetical protein